MKINKVEYSCEKIDESPEFLNNIGKIQIKLDLNDERATITVHAGLIKIEDRSYFVDVKSVLEKMKKIDFEKTDDLRMPRDYCGEKWKFVVNDKVFEGDVAEPYYIIEFKKIIRYSAIELYIQKKIGQYLR